MNVVDEERMVKSFDAEELKQLFRFESDEISTTFDASLNEFERFSNMSPDYSENMRNYLSLVKINSRDANSAAQDKLNRDTQDQADENEFA